MQTFENLILHSNSPWVHVIIAARRAGREAAVGPGSLL